jgi:hypothetical protein
MLDVSKYHLSYSEETGDIYLCIQGPNKLVPVKKMTGEFYDTLVNVVGVNQYRELSQGGQPVFKLLLVDMDREVRVDGNLIQKQSDPQPEG